MASGTQDTSLWLHNKLGKNRFEKKLLNFYFEHCHKISVHVKIYVYENEKSTTLKIIDFLGKYNRLYLIPSTFSNRMFCMFN